MKKIFILGLAALTMTISCQKSNDSLETSSSHCVMRTITCTIAEPDPISKVSINATNGKTTWEVDDEILFHGKYTGEHNSDAYSVVVKLKSNDISADGKTFTATIPDFINGADQAKWEQYGSESNIIAAYPASAVAVHYGDNWYYQNKFNASNLPLMSGFNNEYDSNSFTFYNLTGLLSFIVDGEIDSYTLSGNGSEAVAYTDYASRIYKKTSGSIQTDWVYAGTPVTSVSGTVIPGEETRIFIPGGVTFSGGFTITFSYGGNPVKTLSTTKSVSIDRNSYRPMGNVTSYLADYVAPTTHDSTIKPVPADASDEDLSKTASANCYVVDASVTANSNKIFKFKAVKGNSSEVLTSIESVFIVWETYNNAESVEANSVISDVSYDLQEGGDPYVVFKMPETLHAGNALIAAKNAGGDILWSWHIWVPKDAISYSTYGGKTSSKMMMSRNLGALVDTPTDGSAVDVTSLGLLYQWGRKDPFVGVKSLGSSSFAEVSGTAKTNNGGKMSIAETVVKPTVFGNTSDDLRDWNSTPDNSLWGANGSSKTQYDPCPVGYKVPNRDLLRDFVNAVTWTPSMVNYYVKADDIVDYGFPIANHIYAKYGNMYGYEDGPVTYLWTSYRDDDATGTAYAMRIKNDGSVKLSATYKSSGCSVRCIAE